MMTPDRWERMSGTFRELSDHADQLENDAGKAAVSAQEPEDGLHAIAIAILALCTRVEALGRIVLDGMEPVVRDDE